MRRALISSLSASGLVAAALVSVPLAAANSDPEPGASAAEPTVVTPAAAPNGALGSFGALGTGAIHDVYALTLLDDTLFAGGDFTSMSGVANTNYIAAWSTVNEMWQGLGIGTDDSVRALALTDDTLFAGGFFTSASGAVNTNYIAAWSLVDDTWSPLGTGTEDVVFSLAAADDTLYAGGNFLDASGVADTTLIAAWSSVDDTWHPMGTGLSSGAFALAADTDTVFAGGEFSSASGLTVNNVARWSKASDTWSAMGVGVSNGVRALALMDDTVYAGGFFTLASGVAGTNRVAAWSTGDDTWHALGTGLNDRVQALAVDGTRNLVYAGGAFTDIGGEAGTDLQRVGVWDEGIAEWIPLTHLSGNGVNSTVYALAIDDSAVYIGGAFTDAGGVAAADRIAQWTWEPPQGSNTVTAQSGTSVTLTGEGFIGVPDTGGVKVGATPAAYTRDDSATITITVPAGSFTDAAITVDGVGGWGEIGTLSSPTPAVDGVLGSFYALGTGVAGMFPSVMSLAVGDDTVYAGGFFDEASGVANTGRVAAWSTVDDTWRALGVGASGAGSAAVRALAVVDDTVFAGGDFPDASGVANTSQIAAWSVNEDAWSALGTGTTSTVRALAVGDGTVFAGGDFPDASGVANTDYIAAWSIADDAWSSLGSGMEDFVLSLAVSDDTLYAGGSFLDASGVAGTSRVAAWSSVDDTWHALGTGMDNSVVALGVRGDTVFAGGAFTSASGVAGTSRVAAWSVVDDTWNSMGTGLNNSVFALAVDGLRGLVYAGGYFTDASGGGALNRVGVWDEGISEWIPMAYRGGLGVNNTVQALALDDSVVYLGGSFSNAGGVLAADYIARWVWDPPVGSNTLTAASGATVVVTGEGFIGVRATGGVKVGSTPVTYTRDDSTTIRLTVPSGTLSNAPITVEGVGGVGQVGTLSSPSPTPDPGPNPGPVPPAPTPTPTPTPAPSPEPQPIPGVIGPGQCDVLVDGASVPVVLDADRAAGRVRVEVGSAVMSLDSRDDSGNRVPLGDDSGLVLRPGGELDLQLQGLAPDSAGLVLFTPEPQVPASVTLPRFLRSWASVAAAGDAVTLATFTAGTDGAVDETVEIPTSLDSGGGVVQLAVIDDSLQQMSVFLGVIVRPAPAPDPDPTIVITGSRGDVRGRPGIIVEGVTTGLVGATVMPRFKFPGQVSYSDGIARRVVDDAGEFTWQRRTAKKIYIIFMTEDRSTRSNRIIIRPSR